MDGEAIPSVLSDPQLVSGWVSGRAKKFFQGSYPEIAVGNVSSFAVALLTGLNNQVPAILHARHLAIHRCELGGIDLVVVELSIPPATTS